jgi:hypothetical protein
MLLARRATKNKAVLGGKGVQAPRGSGLVVRFVDVYCSGLHAILFTVSALHLSAIIPTVIDIFVLPFPGRSYVKYYTN